MVLHSNFDQSLRTNMELQSDCVQSKIKCSFIAAVLLNFLQRIDRTNCMSYLTPSIQSTKNISYIFERLYTEVDAGEEQMNMCGKFQLKYAQHHL